MENGRMSSALDALAVTDFDQLSWCFWVGYLPAYLSPVPMGPVLSQIFVFVPSSDVSSFLEVVSGKVVWLRMLWWVINTGSNWAVGQRSRGKLSICWMLWEVSSRSRQTCLLESTLRADPATWEWCRTCQCSTGVCKLQSNSGSAGFCSSQKSCVGEGLFLQHLWNRKAISNTCALYGFLELHVD